jgi:peptide/nickel transport system substrate-binding protein
VPADVTELVNKAGGAATAEEARDYYRKYAEALIDNANYVILFQPVYRVAVRNSIKNWEMTAAGWQVDLGVVEPG